MSLPPFTFRQSTAADFPSWLALLPHEMQMDPQLAQQLPALWTNLVDNDAIEARTITSVTVDGVQVDAFGASVFLRPGLFEELVSRPRPHLAESIYRAMLAGERPVLTGREIAKANSGAGVDVCVLHFCERPVDLNDPIGQQLLAMGHAAFRDAHLGYNLRALMHQNFRPQHKVFLLASGMALFHEFTANEAGNVDDASVIVGMTRERSLAEPVGSPISLLFRTELPRIYFTASERRVMRAALSGASDRDIAKQLGVSRDAIKGAWKNVFRRVDEGARKLSALDASREGGTTQRRRQLLEYIRQHPEELRPYLRPRG
jgi:DNA-binding CsgD family transcriptional regulator